METNQQIFFILGALKCDFCRVLTPTVSGTPSILQLLFCILDARKCDFCRVVKPRVQGYQSSYEQIFLILAAWKWDFCRFITERFKVPSKEWGNYLHFWALKIRFWRVVKSTFQGYQASCEQIFHILVNGKCDFFRFVKSIFSAFWWYVNVNWTVYWRKLDGLLTETGLCTEGIWTVYWRKVDVLLTETGWSVDGNWMVYWRKLDGLLMDTVQ